MLLFKEIIIDTEQGVPKKVKDFFRFGNSGHSRAILGTFRRPGKFLTFAGTLGTFGHFWALLARKCQELQNQKMFNLVHRSGGDHGGE